MVLQDKKGDLFSKRLVVLIFVILAIIAITITVYNILKLFLR